MIDINQEPNNKIVKKPKNNLYATGKRKSSIARVWLMPNGKGEITINKKNLNEYFIRSFLNMLIKQPFETVDNNNFNVNATVKGGGLSGQAGAIKLAISKDTNSTLLLSSSVRFFSKNKNSAKSLKY